MGPPRASLPHPPSGCLCVWVCGLWERLSLCVRLVTAPSAHSPVSVSIFLGGYLSFWVPICFSPFWVCDMWQK